MHNLVSIPTAVRAARCTNALQDLRINGSYRLVRSRGPGNFGSLYQDQSSPASGLFHADQRLSNGLGDWRRGGSQARISEDWTNAALGCIPEDEIYKSLSGAEGIPQVEWSGRERERPNQIRRR